MKYEKCKHCGEQSHYYWNCPLEHERETKRIKSSIEYKLNSITDNGNRTVKRIYQHLQIIKSERTTLEIAERVNVSANTARKWLYLLERSGLVKFRTKYYGRGVYLMLWSYVNEQI